MNNPDAHHQSREHNVADKANNEPEDDQMGLLHSLAGDRNKIKIRLRKPSPFPICNIASTKLCANVHVMWAGIGAYPWA
jgi:hypothetical protein